MTWNKTRRPPWAACLAILLLTATACTEVRYLREGTAEPAAGPLDRTVVYKVDGAFYRSPPRCAVVMPIRWPGADPRLVRQVEDALGRYLTAKVDRVIGPAARDRAARRRVFDLGDAEQRRRLARALGCDTVVEGETRAADSTFALVWARTRFGLAVSLERASDGRRLWRASHTAERSAGGRPAALHPGHAQGRLLGRPPDEGRRGVSFHARRRGAARDGEPARHPRHPLVRTIDGRE